ncbi:MAG: DUF3141 domain-containing protein [Phycisphaeraceae bacterium]|nr:DUF3141 domain-containing protein [Phycisphaeraceae bacterium]
MTPSNPDSSPPAGRPLPEGDHGAMLARLADVCSHRVAVAEARFIDRMQTATSEFLTSLPTEPKSPWDLWMEASSEWCRASVDFVQRAVLFGDTMRQRGNQFLARARAGHPPVLDFEWETVLDGRTFDRPVNYALVRIIPPQGVTVDPKSRPYLIIDPRAGHGPGIGGFKDESQVGVALRAGHPVYFVIFFVTPQPGQTLDDVCAAERRFVQEIRARHPNAPKPAIVGNCQGGWAAMMLAASDPAEAGPLVINGAPMSYWSGAGTDGAGDNPMRYAGGLLGGSWLASLTADLGHGLFDGAWLVQNFENLNPANTLWSKPYKVFADADTEPPRFLEFERWWGGFYLMNREEIEWIVGNLFIGNSLWSGRSERASGPPLDLREIRSPIILFASLGDNITPPQQAFNWVADIYGSTEEIKARGQVIVGLVHESVGHLGIFVSGRVAQKEHAQIVSTLEAIDALPPGLHAMQITETTGPDGRVEYAVSFSERRLEEVVARINRFERRDERAFHAAARVSEVNSQAYESLLRPWVQMVSNDFSAEVMRHFHPLRFERWAFSDLNPWVWWLAPAADAVRACRMPVASGDPARRFERLVDSVVSASLDRVRAIRDALSEALFYATYQPMLSFLPDAPSAIGSPGDGEAIVAEALAAIDHGGYDEAFARTVELLARDGPIELSHLELRRELHRDLLPMLPMALQDLSTLAPYRAIRGRQQLIVRHAPERAIATLPRLVHQADDRERLLAVLDAVERDDRVRAARPTPGQIEMLAAIRSVLRAPGHDREREPHIQPQVEPKLVDPTTVAPAERSADTKRSASPPPRQRSDTPRDPRP